VDQFECNKDQNVEKREKFNVGTENSVWECYYRRKTVTIPQ